MTMARRDLSRIGSFSLSSLPLLPSLSLTHSTIIHTCPYLIPYLSTPWDALCWPLPMLLGGISIELFAAEQFVRGWISRVLGDDAVLPENEDLMKLLQDGVILCRVVHAIQPALVPKVFSEQRSRFKQMENASLFLAACKALGVPPLKLFRPVDLVEGRNPLAVLQTVQALAAQVEHAGLVDGQLDADSAPITSTTQLPPKVLASKDGKERLSKSPSSNMLKSDTFFPPSPAELASLGVPAPPTRSSLKNSSSTSSTNSQNGSAKAASAPAKISPSNSTTTASTAASVPATSKVSFTPTSPKSPPTSNDSLSTPVAPPAISVSPSTPVAPPAATPVPAPASTKKEPTSAVPVSPSASKPAPPAALESSTTATPAKKEEPASAPSKRKPSLVASRSGSGNFHTAGSQPLTPVTPSTPTSAPSDRSSGLEFLADATPPDFADVQAALMDLPGPLHADQIAILQREVIRLSPSALRADLVAAIEEEKRLSTAPAGGGKTNSGGKSLAKGQGSSSKSDLKTTEAVAALQQQVSLLEIAIAERENEITRLNLQMEKYRDMTRRQRRLLKDTRDAGSAGKHKSAPNNNAPFSLFTAPSLGGYARTHGDRNAQGPARFTSVSDVGVVHAKNEMEELQDTFVVIDRFFSDMGFFAVYDGHAGLQAASFAAMTLHNILLGYLNSTPGAKLSLPDTVCRLLKETFLQCDSSMEELGLIEDGTTAVTVLVHKALPPATASPRSVEGAGAEESSSDINKPAAAVEPIRYLHYSNVGDSLAVLSRKGVAVQLSISHNARNADERTRITAAGGHIKESKGDVRLVAPGTGTGLQVTRSLGDRMFKKFAPAMLSEPATGFLTLDHGDEFCILASDGVWDAFTPQQAVDHVRKIPTAQGKADALREEAVRRKTRDNITVVVLHLDNPVQLDSIL